MAARALDLYLGEDNQIWAYDSATGIGYRMPPALKHQHPPVSSPPADTTILTSPDGSCKVSVALNNYGDIIVSQSAGPNAGKAANISYGKWA